MKINKHGEVFGFTCKHCGCSFTVGANDTCVNHAGVSNGNEVYHLCPDCGESVLGKRLSWANKQEKEVENCG